MSINTKRVAGRHQIQYATYKDLLADAERLAAGPVRAAGNWTPGQIFRHLATAFNCSIDGFNVQFPWVMRKLAGFFKTRLTDRPMPAGLKLPAGLAKVVLPEPTTTDDGLAALRAAISRLEHEPNRAEHPILGRLTREEWDRIHMHHSSLHMSFLSPE